MKLTVSNESNLLDIIVIPVLRVKVTGTTKFRNFSVVDFIYTY